MGGSRNETIADCGLRNGNVSADRRAPLDRPTVALVRVAAALAEGKIDVLRDRFGAARADRVPDRWIEELLLQSLLVVGYPLALVAFGVWREVSGPVSRSEEHTSELQSQSNLVCRLLLEKKQICDVRVRFSSLYCMVRV